MVVLMQIAVGLVVVAAKGNAAEITAEPSEKGVVVKIDGQLFAEYVTDFNGTPIVWPIIGPTGKPMTQSHPEDHPHHRSLWFTHGDVNGLSFWQD
jgi:hypothetical protein